MQDYKDESRIQFINFDFVTGGQEIKVSILVEFEFFSRYFVGITKPRNTETPKGNIETPKQQNNETKHRNRDGETAQHRSKTPKRRKY